MRKYFLILLILFSAAGFSQTTSNIIYGKDVIIQTRDSSSAELTIKNSTRNVLGYFKNIGGGKGKYVLIPQSDISALPDSLLARYTKSQADARFKSISYVPSWIDITGKPSNFSTTYALSNDVKDSIQKRLSVTITSPALGNLIRYNGSQWVNWAPTFLNVADSFFANGYTTRSRLKQWGDSALATKQNLLTNPVTGTGTNGRIAFWNGTNTQTGSNNLFWDASRNSLGIGTSSVTKAKLQIGDRDTIVGVDPLVLLNRTVDNSITGNGRGVADNSLVNRTGGVAYNSFDARAEMGGTNNYDHYAAFQNGGIHSSTGTMTHMYGLYSRPSQNAGVLTNLYAGFADDPIGAGTIVNNNGFYVANLTRGTNNYGVNLNLSSGANKFNIYAPGTANNYLNGALGVGALPLSSYTVRVGKTITGGTISFGVGQEGVVQSGVTNRAFGFYNQAETQAASFSLSEYIHYGAAQSSIGSGSSIGTQIGFNARSNMIGANNNRGFQSDIPAGTNNWGAYFSGTANNYFNGRTLFGTTTEYNNTTRVQVNGGILATLGVTAQRGSLTSLLLNKDSVPITTTNLWVTTLDTTGTVGANILQRRDISQVHTGTPTFDTTSRTLTIPLISGSTTSVVIPRGTSSGTSGIVALSSNRVGDLVTISGDNGSSTTFSIRDADSTTRANLIPGIGLIGSSYNGVSVQTWTADTTLISTKANVTGLLTGYATTSSLSAYKLASDSFFSNGYTTRARLKQYGDSLSNATNFIYPESYGAVADGATNSRTALQAAVDASASLKKTLVLSGRYYTDSTITIPEGASIMGNGTGTTNSIYTTSNTPIFNINGSNVLIRGISFLGSGRVGPAYTTNNQHGIRVYGSADLLTNKKRIHISDCGFYDLAGAGIYVAQNVGDFFEGGVQVSNSYAFSCGVGFFTDIRGEYNSFSNNYAYACWVGWRNAGGNNRWIGGQLTSNYTGAYFEGGANNGHGKLVGAALNHNTEYAVWSNGVTIGMDIDNCNIYVNDIYIQDSRGIKFNGNDFSVNNIYFENSTDIEFVNNKYTTTPVFDTTFNGTTSTYRFFNEYFWATTPSIIKNTLKQQLIVEGSIKGTKIIGNSATPSVSLGTGITGSVSVTGTDLAGTVTVTVTGASSLATLNELFTITYSSAYSSIPHVVWSPASANAAALLQAAGGLYLKNSGTSSFQIATVNSYTTPGSATYSFTYHVIQ